MLWYIRDAEMRQLITAEETNQVIEQVFLNQAEGKVDSRPTAELSLPRGALRVKLGADWAAGVYGFKAYPAGGRYLIALYDVETGLDAMVEARQLTELRTGAVSAVGVKYMARPESSTMGIIGTGREARQQLASTALVCNLKKVWCYSRSAENRETFAREMTERIGVEVVPASSGEECVRDADIVTTITNSQQPVLYGAWLREGTHITAVGGTTPDRRELDDEAVARCGTIAVELKEGAVNEIGELIHAVEHGILSWDKVHELKDIVSGAVKGRENAQEITLNDTVGIGAADVALAWHALKKARQLGIGIELNFEPPYHTNTNTRPPAEGAAKA